jgi:protein TonB
MSQSSSSAQTPFGGASTFGSGEHNYQLSDDLARLCLPQEFSDSYRILAWVDSICFLFLVIGLVGLKPPQIVQRPLSEPPDTVPVVLTPPEEPPKTEPEVKPDEEQQPQDTPEQTPQVVTVVAAADPSKVAFAVPVQGAVAIAAEARLASPPPTVTHVQAAPVRFNPDTAKGGSFPKPGYPGSALRNHEEGTVTIEIMVDESGKITEAKVLKTSGHPVLDDAALQAVTHTWRFPAGQKRWYYWPFSFQME